MFAEGGGGDGEEAPYCHRGVWLVGQQGTASVRLTGLDTECLNKELVWLCVGVEK